MAIDLPMQPLNAFHADVEQAAALTTPTPDELVARIQQLKAERNAVILAHNYQRPEIFDVADFAGDSYGLSVSAKKAQAEVIVFCGVRFMAETAAILSPDATVLLPEAMAGCGLADAITGDDVRAMKAQNPGVPVCMYINCTAEVKAESDVICTSSNAIRVVNALEGDKVIFGPDANLAAWVQKHTDKELIVWEGYCPVHKDITAAMLEETERLYPDAVTIVHPECGPEVVAEADEVLSTSGMVDFVKQSSARRFIIGTEIGLIHKLRREVPDKEVHPIYRHKSCDQACSCPFMKLTGLQSVLRALETDTVRITVEEPLRSRAQRAIDAMLDIGLG